MTRDDIIKLARESGVWDAVGFPVEIERFADLVAARGAAAERVQILLYVERIDTPETRQIAYFIRDRMKK